RIDKAAKARFIPMFVQGYGNAGQTSQTDWLGNGIGADRALPCGIRRALLDSGGLISPAVKIRRARLISYDWIWRLSACCAGQRFSTSDRQRTLLLRLS